MKKFISMHSNKIFYFISIILVIMIFFKTSFVNNLKNVLESSENERITKLYGYCKNESIGYLKYLKKNMTLNLTLKL